jgi:hypothetical protein
MTRAELAEQLRSKIREGGRIPPEMLAGLDDLDDEVIVNSYLNTTCEDCGRKLTEGIDVEQILAKSQGLDDFFGLCVDAQEHTHTFAHVHWPTEI